jgi:hypothetical protein
MFNESNVLKDSHICNSPARVSARCGSCFGKTAILDLREFIANHISEEVLVMKSMLQVFFVSSKKKGIVTVE